MSIKNYRDLAAWQHSMSIVKIVYEHTRGFPREEIYGLTSQMRRAATSVPANIAEGSGRGTTKEFLRFIDIANGSLKELETHILIAEQLNFFSPNVVEDLLKKTNEIGRIIYYLKGSLERKMQTA